VEACLVDSVQGTVSGGEGGREGGREGERGKKSSMETSSLSIPAF
jgi:hypothetical protein